MAQVQAAPPAPETFTSTSAPAPLPPITTPSLESRDTSGEDTFNSVQEYGVSVEDIRNVASQNLDFLAALAAPLSFTLNFPPVFLNVWSWLLEFIAKPRSFPQLALGLPRGFGKTTLVKLFILYCILFTQKKFILIISAKASLAQNILSDVVDMLEEENIKQAFGDWKVGVEKDTQEMKKFGYRGRNIILAAIGAETSLRGLNLKNSRPDVMVFEDIQSRECADSEVQSTNLENWMVGTAMKAKSPTGCMFLFVANMYPTKHSILRKLKYNHRWTKFIAGGILEDGTSIWEELQPVAQLLTEFDNDLSMGKPEIFYAEVLNDENAAANNLINLNALPDIPYDEGDIAAGNFIVIDPSNDKANSDHVAIGYFEVHDAKPILIHAKSDRLSPGDTIREALKYALTHNCRLIAVESVAFQFSLLYWFKFICNQLGIVGIEAVPVYPGTKSKITRILDMLKGYSKGEVYIHPRCRALAHGQITSFNPLKNDNVDDILDVLTYPPKILAEYSNFIVANNIIESQEYSALEVPDFNSPF
jgi:hypothetical protein